MPNLAQFTILLEQIRFGISTFILLCLYNHIIFLFWSVSVLTVFFRYCVRFFVNPLTLYLYIYTFLRNSNTMNEFFAFCSFFTHFTLNLLPYIKLIFWCFTCVVLYTTDNTHVLIIVVRLFHFVPVVVAFVEKLQTLNPFGTRF